MKKVIKILSGMLFINIGLFSVLTKEQLKNPNTPDRRGKIPLQYAIDDDLKTGSFNDLDALLEAGANVNLLNKNNENILFSRNLLYSSYSSSNPDNFYRIFSKLIDLGINYNQKNSDQKTSLDTYYQIFPYRAYRSWRDEIDPLPAAIFMAELKKGSAKNLDKNVGIIPYVLKSGNLSDALLIYEYYKDSDIFKNWIDMHISMDELSEESKKNLYSDVERNLKDHLDRMQFLQKQYMLLELLNRMQSRVTVNPEVAKEFLKLSSSLNPKNQPKLIFPENFSQEDKNDLRLIVNGYLTAKEYGYKKFGKYILSKMELIAKIIKDERDMMENIISFKGENVN